MFFPVIHKSITKWNNKACYVVFVFVYCFDPCLQIIDSLYQLKRPTNMEICHSGPAKPLSQPRTSG